jgi:hypothetical protein
VTFAGAARQAVATLLQVYYAGGGLWRACNASDCSTGNADWGDDSLTYALALRYATTRDPRLRAPLLALAGTAPSYGAPCAEATGCGSWSDVPEWDAIALADEYAATGDPSALAKAEAAFGFVEQSGAYALGACPRIRYQQPGGRDNQLKTLETDANSIKAALLLYRYARKADYLAAARLRYDSVRAYFLDPGVPLYSVYVFDDGSTCTQLPHRFFASVNGDMIWSGWSSIATPATAPISSRQSRPRRRWEPTSSTGAASSPTCRRRTTWWSRSSRRCTSSPATDKASRAGGSSATPPPRWPRAPATDPSAASSTARLR